MSSRIPKKAETRSVAGEGGIVSVKEMYIAEEKQKSFEEGFKIGIELARRDEFEQAVRLGKNLLLRYWTRVSL